MASPLCLVFVAVAMIAAVVSGNGVPVYVMMPLNTVNPDCTLNDPQLIYQQLQVSSTVVVNVSNTNNASFFHQTLKSVGVTGIMRYVLLLLLPSTITPMILFIASSYVIPARGVYESEATSTK